LHVTDIHESDDTLQAVATAAEHTTPTVLAEPIIDDDDDINDHLGGKRNEDSPIDNDIGDHRFQITDQDCLDVATHNRFMLEMLIKNKGL